MINLLCFDGGGVRGIYSARVMINMLNANPKLLDTVDLIAGTSTGSILAMAMAYGLPPTDVMSLYYHNAGKIFDSSWIKKVTSIDGLDGAQYDNQELHTILFNIFGSKKLKDLNKKVLIPTFQLDSQINKIRAWKPKLFHNIDETGDGEEKIVDVIMRSTAAPVYFPTYGQFVDGGIVLNNPSLSAVAQMIESCPCDVCEINCLSIGTTFSPEFIEGENLDWGVAQWARPLVSMFMDGNAGVTHYMISKILGSRYLRVNTTLPHHIRMDSTDPNDMIYLVHSADQMPYEAYLAWFNSVNWAKIPPTTP